VTSPDGLIIEFTQDPEDVTEVDAARRADARQELARWLAGDRRTTTELRGRAMTRPRNFSAKLGLSLLIAARCRSG